VPDSDPTVGLVRLGSPGGGFLRARLLVENLLRAHKLEPGRHLLFENPDSCSWLFWAATAPGSRGIPDRTLVVLSVFVAQGAGYLRASSPVLQLPEVGEPGGLYRRLLDLNSEMVDAALATVGLEVHVVAVRPALFLDGAQVEDVLQRVVGYSNVFRGQLAREFGARPWQLTTPEEGTGLDDGGHDDVD